KTPSDRRPPDQPVGIVSGRLGLRAGGLVRRDESYSGWDRASAPAGGAARPRPRRVPRALAARDAPCRRSRPGQRRRAPVPAPDPHVAPGRPVGARVRGRPPPGRGRPNRAVAARRGPRPHEGGSPILVRPRTFGGVLPCAVLLAATWPMLAALPGVPSQFLA